MTLTTPRQQGGDAAPRLPTASASARTGPRSRRFRSAKFIREAHEDVVERPHTAAQMIRRNGLLEREADHDADVVKEAGEEKAHKGQGE
jgi:hypothetical protein